MRSVLGHTASVLDEVDPNFRTTAGGPYERVVGLLDRFFPKPLNRSVIRANMSVRFTRPHTHPPTSVPSSGCVDADGT